MNDANESTLQYTPKNDALYQAKMTVASSLIAKDLIPKHQHPAVKTAAELADSASLVNIIDGNDLTWVRISSASVETQTFYITASDGGVLFMQMAHTYLGYV